jgi:hypothetical protein
MCANHTDPSSNVTSRRTGGRKLRFATAASVLALGLVAGGPAFACEAEKMMKTENGLIFKVVGGSDKVEAKKEPGGKDAAFTLDLLTAYYVICDAGESWKITDLRAETVDEALKGKVGYVAKNQVFRWITREALSFTPLIKKKDRPELVAWDDESVFEKFVQSGDSTANPPTFREDVAKSHTREGARRPYPVLGSKTQKFGGSVDKQTFNVLLPAELPEGSTLDIPTAGGEKGAAEVVEQIKKVLGSGTFAIAFDATASMGPFAEKVAKSLRSAFESLDPDVKAGTKIGFVFYRDKEDAEKIVITPEPMTLPAAADLLSTVAKDGMTGGGDVAEPVLDAVYVAAHLFPWTSKDDQGGGNRTIIAVLSGDAKPATEGAIDERVPTGLDAAAIGQDLLGAGIPVLTVQAGPDSGENLTNVLSTLATQTNSEFIEWGSGEQVDKIAAAVANSLTKGIVEKAKKDKATADEVTKMAKAVKNSVTIPLEILDGAKLEMLRKAGIEFNIEDGKDGVLVREGFMLDNELLLKRQIEIEKSTVQALVKLFSTLAIAGADAESLKKSAGEAIAAIAGEDYDPKEPIGTLVSKKLGINFNTPMLEFDLDYLIAMSPAERTTMSKRIQDAADKLSDFLQANLEQFDTLPAVWMDVAYLP